MRVSPSQWKSSRIPRTKIPDELRSIVASEYPEHTPNQIAEKHNVSITSVFRIIRESGKTVADNRQRYDPVLRAKLQSMMESGMTRREIIAATGLTIGQVNNGIYADKSYRKRVKDKKKEEAISLAPTTYVQRKCCECRMLFTTTRYIYRCSKCSEKELPHDGVV